MRKKRNGIAYGAGILGLAASIAAAWFLPEMYGTWQDGRQIGKVTLSKRGSIDFLDGTVLDQIGRWRALTTQIEEGNEAFWEQTEIPQMILGGDSDGYIAACREEIARWCGSGLLPADAAKEELYISSLDTRILYVGAEVIPVGIFVFQREQQQDFYDDFQIKAVMDVETKKLYYVSVTGGETEDYMAQQLGHESSRKLGVRLFHNVKAELGTPDVEGMDFASVCGAAQCSAQAQKGSLELTAQLTFDDFTIAAQRFLVRDVFTRAYGIAVMYGPRQDVSLFGQCLYISSETWEEMELEGTEPWYEEYEEERLSTEKWLEHVESMGY